MPARSQCNAGFYSTYLVVLHIAEELERKMYPLGPHKSKPIDSGSAQLLADGGQRVPYSVRQLDGDERSDRLPHAGALCAEWASVLASFPGHSLPLPSRRCLTPEASLSRIPAVEATANYDARGDRKPKPPATPHTGEKPCG